MAPILSSGGDTTNQTHNAPVAARTMAGIQNHPRSWQVPSESDSSPTDASASTEKEAANTKRLCDIMLIPGIRNNATTPGTLSTQLNARNPNSSQNRMTD